MSLRPMRLFDSPVNRMIAGIILGIIISSIISYILISIGYANAYLQNASALDVTIFGAPIYLLHREGGGYVGEAVGQNMAVFGIACAVVLSLIIELLWRRRHNRRP